MLRANLAEPLDQPLILDGPLDGPADAVFAARLPEPSVDYVRLQAGARRSG